jgi:transcriptional regulator with XRE-family HTH domain
MRSAEFRQTRQLLRLTQGQLAERLRTTRRSIIRYEDGNRRTLGWPKWHYNTSPRLKFLWRVLWTTGRRCVCHENGC